MSIVRVIRNTTNYVSGYVLLAIVVLLFLLGDPWMIRIREELPPSDRMTPVQSLGVTAGLCALATIGTILVRAKVLVNDDCVIVVNPVWKWTIPIAQIVALKHSILLGIVLKSGGTVYAVAGERSLAMILRGDPVADVILTGGLLEAEVRRSARGALWLLVPWFFGFAVSIYGYLAGT